MEDSSGYPLEQLKNIKKNRFDQAVKILEEKKALLDKAKLKLYDVMRERDEVLSHKKNKLEQLRNALDEGTTTDKIGQMKLYMKVVDQQLAEKEKKVTEQKKVVDAAQKQVDVATADMFQKKKDVEKLEMHKTQWQKEAQYATQQKEAVEQDEQGSSTHALRKREAKARKKEKNDHAH
ncbi:MAG: type III secretion T3S chaperone [Chlamydiales bacterium]|nr:type III secretion T3S chaperone [Chlamydiales bacterium]